MLFFLNLHLDSFQLLQEDAGIDGELDSRFEPKLRFVLWRLDMDVHPGLLAREKEEPQFSEVKDGRAHARLDTKAIIVRRESS